MAQRQKIQKIPGVISVLIGLCLLLPLPVSSRAGSKGWATSAGSTKGRSPTAAFVNKLSFSGNLSLEKSRRVRGGESSHERSAVTPTSLSMSSPTEEPTRDLAVVGCGVLGTSLCRQIMQEGGSVSAGLRSVTAITKTSSRHDSIRDSVLGPSSSSSSDCSFEVATMDDVLASERKFDNVVFCAPPSGFDDYPAAVKEALDNLWVHANEDSGTKGGVFVFTSSGGVYEGRDGETVTEKCPTVDPEKNPRQGRLVNAEKECLQGNGTVLRLAGLYLLERGAHNFWLTSGKDVNGRPDGIINLLHYDDAAGACLAALVTSNRDKDRDGDSLSGNIFLISDGHPSTRKGICESALKHERYKDCELPKFLGGELLGKVYDGSWSNERLGWSPVYKSFDDFMSL